MKYARYVMLGSMLLIPTVSRAQTIQGWLTDFLLFLRFVPTVLLAVAVLLFLWGLVLNILNVDNEEKRKEARQKMIWGIVALFVMVSIWGLVNMLIVFFGVGGLPTCDGVEIINDGVHSCY